MKILDTDTLTLFFSGHERVVSRRQMETDEVAITSISRIETLLGRFAMLLKAPNGVGLRRAQQWLDQTVDHLTAIPTGCPLHRFRGHCRAGCCGASDGIGSRTVLPPTLPKRRYSARIARKTVLNHREE